MVSMATKKRSPLELLSNAQCRELSGSYWKVNSAAYQFSPMAGVGSPSWRKGAEGIAFPLVDQRTGQVTAWLKMFKSSIDTRRQRVEWLIRQKLGQKSLHLTAVPSCWIDTRDSARPEGINFDFCGSLSQAVPGKSWSEWKTLMHDDGQRLDDRLRLRAAFDLLHVTAELERNSCCHGDLSPGNTVVDLQADPNEPVLRPCDFDAFVALNASGRAIQSLGTAAGGTCGTPGYSPPALQQNCLQGRNVIPESDRYGRDILLLELLGFGPKNDPDLSPVYWSKPDLNRLWKCCQARLSCSDHRAAAVLRKYLAQGDLLTRTDQQRLPSTQLLKAVSR